MRVRFMFPPANSSACFWKTQVGFVLCSDIPMAQFIINLNASLPASQKFIIHVLDGTHLFVQPHAAEMIRSAVSEFRDQNSYEKPAWNIFHPFPQHLLSFACHYQLIDVHDVSANKLHVIVCFLSSPLTNVVVRITSAVKYLSKQNWPVSFS